MTSPSPSVHFWGGIFFVGLVTLAIAAWVQWMPLFADGDATHHIRMAERLRAGEDLAEFPWLPRTTLATRFADQHWLFHALVVPFLGIVSSFVGLKVATAVFVAAMAMSFFALVSSYAPRFAALATMILVTTTPFLHRVSQGKAVVVELTLLFLVALALRKRAMFFVPPLIFLSVWAHGSWPLVVVLLVVWVAVMGWREHWRVLALSLVAVAIALFAHPNFPNIIFFFWDQTIRIALGSVIVPGGGNEWSAPTFGWFVSEAPILSFVIATLPILFALGCARRLLAREHFVYLFMAVLTSFLFMRSTRHIEFAAPFLVLALVALVHDVWGNMSLADLMRRAIPYRALRVSAAIAFGLVIGIGIVSARGALAEGRPFSSLQGVALFAKEHIPPGTFFLSDAWDAFPNFLYWNDTQTHTAGLDPRFYAYARPEEYRAWMRLAFDDAVVPSVAMRDTFTAEYLFVVRRTPSTLFARAHTDEGLILLYEDDEAAIFRLKNAAEGEI